MDSLPSSEGELSPRPPQQVEPLPNYQYARREQGVEERFPVVHQVAALQQPQPVDRYCMACHAAGNRRRFPGCRRRLPGREEIFWQGPQQHGMACSGRSLRFLGTGGPRPAVLCRLPGQALFMASPARTGADRSQLLLREHAEVRGSSRQGRRAQLLAVTGIEKVNVKGRRDGGISGRWFLSQHI